MAEMRHIAIIALMFSGCVWDVTGGYPDAGPPPDSGSPYCAVLERDCWCHLAGARAVCYRTAGDCEYHREHRDAGADTEPCTMWMRLERDAAF